jgi:AraC-like DNA-binding protein
MIAFAESDSSQRLFHSDVLTVTDYRCRVAGDVHVIESHPSHHQLLFTRAGAFLRHSIAGDRKMVADPIQIHLLNAGERLQVSHPNSGGHDWTSFSFGADVIAKVAGIEGKSCERRLFSHTHATASPKILLGYQRIRSMLRDVSRAPSPNSPRIEAQAIELLGQVLSCAGSANRNADNRFHSLKQRNMVESAKFIMASAPGRPHRLSELSRELDISPSHLAHIFRAVVGMSLHQYLLYLRMAVALDQLREGRVNLSGLALDLGFSTHSHFTAAFRDCFGVPPSEVRKRVSRLDLETHFAGEHFHAVATDRCANGVAVAPCLDLE